jgi:hypothetical protein
MKKIISLVILLFIIGCSQSDSAQNGDIARRFTSCFAIKGNYLYGVDQMKLNVFSLIDSEKPVKLRDFYMVLILKPCFHIGDNLFIGSRNGMFIYSISNPENPTKLSSVQHFTVCDPVTIARTLCNLKFEYHLWQQHKRFTSL